MVKSRSTTEGPTGAGGASPVNGGRDDIRTVSARRWVPPSKVRRDALTQENKQDAIFRRVRGILNKLTPEKFDKLSDDLLKEELNSDVVLKGVILLLFEKALDEPKYSAMYAQLCRRLCEEIRSADQPEPCPFRNVLLSSCRAQFVNRSKHTNNKRKSLGNIKFIGELCKLGILQRGILYMCLIQLLENKTAKTHDEMAEDLECVCQILRTCGHILDTDEAQKMMNQIFNRIASLSKNVKLPIRIRFMLRDIIELRRDKWVPRKVSNTEGPLPIHQLTDDAGSTLRGNSTERPPQQEFFGRPLKTRSGLDNILSSSLSFPQHDKFPYNSNGFQTPFNTLGPNPRDRGSQRQNFHHLSPNNSHFYQQNRYNNSQHNNNNSNNVSNNKDLAPRYIKRIITGHDNSATIELRPPANSMLFKPPNTKPVSSSLFSGRTDSLTPSMKPQNPPPIQTTKEVPILIKQASSDRGKPNKKEKAATKEETLKKTSSIAVEVMTGSNIDEAATNFSQLKIQDRLVSECISSAACLSFSKTDEEKENLRTFLVTLHKQGAMTPSHFGDAFRSIVKAASDFDSSCSIYQYVAEMASDAIKESYLTIAQVGDLTEDGSNYPLLYLTLAELNKGLGKDKLLQLFSQSKVSLMNSLNDRERTKTRLNEVLEERQLVFLEPLLVLERELWSALEREPTAQSLYRCAKESISSEHHSSPAFITALMTVTLRYITQEANVGKSIGSETAQDAKLLQEKEKALLERFKSVLQAFLHEDVNLQVTAVYALQVFCFAIDFPKGMLLRWFVNLYHLEIVEEEAFLKWREDVTDIYPGKGKALFQVNQWLTWLAEAESEEEEDEEGDN